MAKITLRSWQSTDFDAYEQLIVQPEIMQGAGLPDVDTQQRRMMFETDLYQPFQAAIVYKEQIIGSIITYARVSETGDFIPNEYDLAYFLDNRFAGLGIMTQALRSFIAALPTPTTLLAETFADNVASQRILEKLGFIKTGTYNNIIAYKKPIN